MEEVDERREDLEFGEVSRDPEGSSAKSNGESERFRPSESARSRLGTVGFCVNGRAIGMPYGSDFALVRPRRPACSVKNHTFDDENRVLTTLRRT